MQRRALLAAVAVVAALAFGVGAATIDDALAADAPVVGGDDETLREGGPQAPSAKDGGQSVGCESCGIGLGIGLSVAGALPTIPAVATVPLALAGLATLLVVWRRAGAGDGHAAAVRPDGDAGVASDEQGGLAPPSVDQPPADNAVYRAWLALRERVGGDRETATPGDSERAARERGLDADAAATLRETFERVRYGDAPVTDERAERASGAADALGEDER